MRVLPRLRALCGVSYPATYLRRISARCCRRTALADVSRSQDGIQNRNRKQNAGHTSGLKVIVIESSDEEEEEGTASTRYVLFPLRCPATRALCTHVFNGVVQHVGQGPGRLATDGRR